MFLLFTEKLDKELPMKSVAVTYARNWKNVNAKLQASQHPKHPPMSAEPSKPMQSDKSSSKTQTQMIP